jgi:hypothetical protein
MKENKLNGFCCFAPRDEIVTIEQLLNLTLDIQIE